MSRVAGLQFAVAPDCTVTAASSPAVEVQLNPEPAVMLTAAVPDNVPPVSDSDGKLTLAILKLTNELPLPTVVAPVTLYEPSMAIGPPLKMALPAPVRDDVVVNSANPDGPRISKVAPDETEVAPL